MTSPIKAPKPTAAFPVVELYLVDAKNKRLFITGSGSRATQRCCGIEYNLDAPEHLIPPDGMTWRYVRLKKRTVFK